VTSRLSSRLSHPDFASLPRHSIADQLPLVEAIPTVVAFGVVRNRLGHAIASGRLRIQVILRKPDLAWYNTSSLPASGKPKAVFQPGSDATYVAASTRRMPVHSSGMSH
jgi:hypothetical protein